jgi:hypothetical protein
MPAKRKLLDLARVQRAATETMTVKDAGRPNCFYVESKRGTYLVNIAQDTCTCRDFRHRIVTMARPSGIALRAMRQRRAIVRHTQPNAQCKHLLRVKNGRKLLQAQLLYAPIREEPV